MSLFKSLAECCIPSRCSVNINWCWYNSSLLEVVNFSYLCILCVPLCFPDYNTIIKECPTTSCLGKHILKKMTKFLFITKETAVKMISLPHLAFPSLKRKTIEHHIISWTVFMMEKDIFCNEINNKTGVLP